MQGGKDLLLHSRFPIQSNKERRVNTAVAKTIF